MTEQQTAQACKQPKSGHLIGYLAEQPLHPGTGQALGAIDQPVGREGGSPIPVIPGSSHKGSVKHAITGGSKTCDFWALFGGTDNEGGVLFSDIRLLLLPIRSSVGSYKWATCPYLLERLTRDLARTGRTVGFEVPAVGDGQVLTAGKNGERLYLEELTFAIAGAVDENPMGGGDVHPRGAALRQGFGPPGTTALDHERRRLLLVRPLRPADLCAQ